ncbi:MAG: VOC family protein [Spirochaetia bacterium]|jgi:catechol 2,3-dioxygenase-like lactoylglutathione lyase family enzyme
MKRQIAQFSLVVRDYDDAIRFYTEKLGFDLIEDKGMGAVETDDFQRDYRDMRSRGVVFLEEPCVEPYGLVAVFQDLYGNKWDLLEPRGAKKRPSG